jgi:hypothetical protein
MLHRKSHYTVKPIQRIGNEASDSLVNNNTYANPMFISHIGEQKLQNKQTIVSSIQPIPRITPNRVQNIPIVNVQISSRDVVLKTINILDKIKPIMCERMYRILFYDNESGTDSRKSDGIDYSVYFEEYIKSLKFEKFIMLLQISKFFNKYKRLFINTTNTTNIINHFVDKITDQDKDIIMRYDISDKTNVNTIISISKQNFLELSLETYPDDASIVRQYLLDFPRQDVYINGIFINDVNKMLSLLGSFNRDVKINIKGRNVLSTTMLAIVLTCQSSFYMSFLHLHNKCSKMHNNITDNSNHNINDPKLTMHVSDMKEKNVISIHITRNSFKCSFGAKYRVVDVLTADTIYVVQTEILIDLNIDTGLIVYNVV